MSRRKKRRNPRYRLLTDAANLLEDALLDLADPHAGQSIDLADFLERVRPVLRSEYDAVVTFTVWDPVLTSPPLTVDAITGCDSEASRSLDDWTARPCLLNDIKSSFLTFLHRCPDRLFNVL